MSIKMLAAKQGAMNIKKAVEQGSRPKVGWAWWKDHSSLGRMLVRANDQLATVQHVFESRGGSSSSAYTRSHGCWLVFFTTCGVVH